MGGALSLIAPDGENSLKIGGTLQRDGRSKEVTIYVKRQKPSGCFKINCEEELARIEKTGRSALRRRSAAKVHTSCVLVESEISERRKPCELGLNRSTFSPESWSRRSVASPITRTLSGIIV
jgi:hypothetical protein